MNENIRTWESGVGIVSESENQPMKTAIQRTVKNPKTYSTHERACRYGFSRNPAPIKMVNGSTRWIAMPFSRHDGVIYMYSEVI